MGSVVTAVSDRLTGSAMAQLCQMHAAMARRRQAIRGEDAFGGSAAVAFEVELALEGVLAAYLMQVHGRRVVSTDTGVVSGN